MKKKILTLLLCLCIVAGMLPTTVMATSKTADEAIDWAKSQVGHSVGLDDGTGYYQCVEFIQAYYQWLGADKPYGDGSDYATNRLPSGWTRTAGGQPQKGDILVYSAYAGTAQQYGHVAIYESDSVLYDQNGSVYGATVTKQNAYYKTYTSGYWGCIHPDFSAAVSQPEPTVTFYPWNSSQGLTYIGETDASIGQRINVYNGHCTDTGICLYDENWTPLGEASNGVYDIAEVYFEANDDCECILTPGTTYRYKFYAIVDGKKYWSSDGSFKTNITVPAPTPTPTPDVPANVAVEAVVLNRTSLSLTTGDSSVLTAEVRPSDAAGKAVEWLSGNTSVATVSNGRVTAVGEGSTTIKASCGGVTASCTVTVTAPEDLPYPVGVHFERVNIYFQDQFTDVPANKWYAGNVSDAFELGLMVGKSPTSFKPGENVTIAEAVTMAARIHSIYSKGYEDFRQTGSKWYQVYMDYALENGIIDRAYYNCDVTQNASRAQFAEIFANSLPSGGLPAINHVANGAIPDVGMDNKYAEYIYLLYRAGILTGSDSSGTFNPTTYITRAQAAAVVSRMAESDNRVSITLR